MNKDNMWQGLWVAVGDHENMWEGNDQNERKGLNIE